VSLKQPTEAGVNTNQSRQSAQGQFAATDAFAEKNSKNRPNRPLTPTLSHRERELKVPALLEERRQSQQNLSQGEPTNAYEGSLDFQAISIGPLSWGRGLG
jgi:hypothetical protein